MRKVCWLAILILFLTACSASPTEISITSTPAPTPDAEREEELVYADLLMAAHPSEMFVIMAETRTDIIDSASPDTFQYIENSLTGLSADTLADFKTRNESSHFLKTSMVIDLNYILFSEQEMQDLFRENQNGWDLFYDRYPYAPGIITLSRVGFNQDLDQALVYMGIQSHWLAGAGTYYLLKKVDGAWIIDQQVMTWIS